MRDSLTRRKAVLLLVVAAALAGLSPALAAEKLKVAVLTPGLTNDGSFNQAAADAVGKLAPPRGSSPPKSARSRRKLNPRQSLKAIHFRHRAK